MLANFNSCSGNKADAYFHQGEPCARLVHQPKLADASSSKSPRPHVKHPPFYSNSRYYKLRDIIYEWSSSEFRSKNTSSFLCCECVLY